jgi:hypothetical protein
LVLHRGGDQHFAGNGQKLGVGDALGSGKAADGLVLGDPLVEPLQIEAMRAVDAAPDVRDGDHACAELVGDPCRHSADLAEALDGDSSALHRDPKVAADLDHAGHHATAGRLGTPQRAADLDGLAGDHAGHRVALLLGVGIHHPGHHLGVGAEIRGGDVAVRSDHVDDLGGVAARHSLQLGAGEFVGVDPERALRAAEGEVHDRALPGHPDRQGGHLPEVHVLVVSDAPLGGPHRRQVLNAVPEDRVHLVVAVAAKGKGDHEGALGGAEPFPDVVIQLRQRRSPIQLRDRQAVHGRVPLELVSIHRARPPSGVSSANRWHS